MVDPRKSCALMVSMKIIKKLLSWYFIKLNTKLATFLMHKQSYDSSHLCTVLNRTCPCAPGKLVQSLLWLNLFEQHFASVCFTHTTYLQTTHQLISYIFTVETINIATSTLGENLQESTVGWIM